MSSCAQLYPAATCAAAHSCYFWLFLPDPHTSAALPVLAALTLVEASSKDASLPSYLEKGKGGALPEEEWESH